MPAAATHALDPTVPATALAGSLDSHSADRRSVLVCGASGQQGSAVARHLLRAGHRVTVLTRFPEQAARVGMAGATVIGGDLLDRASLDSALKGVRQVFLVTTRKDRGLEAEVRQGINMADAAKAAGIEHLVYTSVGCADRRTGVPHFDTKYEVEQYILKLGLPATFLRPVFFMENLANSWFGPALERGRLTLPLPPDRAIQMVAVDDIGRFAAAAFARPGEFIGKAVGLAGDELSFLQALRILSAAAGRMLEYEQLGRDDVSRVFGHEWALMFRWFEETGYAVDVPELRRQWGMPVTSFQQWVDRNSVRSLQEREM